MAVDARIRVEGARELGVRLRTASADLRQEMRYANEMAAEVVVDAALPNIPVGATGDLRRSTRPSASVTSGRVVSSTPYAMAIHWGRKIGNVGRPPGNRKGPNPITGRPFLWNAAKEHEEEITAAYKVVVDSLLERTV